MMDELDEMELDARTANNKLAFLERQLRKAGVGMVESVKATMDTDAEVKLTKGYAIQIGGDSFILVQDLGNDEAEFHFDKETKSAMKIVRLVKGMGL